MRNVVAFALACTALLLGGCVTPPPSPVPMDHSKLTPQGGRMGVAMTAMPPIDTHLPGASCLLCLMAASVANSSLTTHAKTLPYEDLPKLKNEIGAILTARGIDVVVIPENLNLDAFGDYSTKAPTIARKDFSPLKKKYQLDKLLVIDIQLLGFVRTYSAYFPTSDPKGTLQGAGYIVNLSNNSYEWYLPVNISRSADKTWDEPPKFPGLTNAYFQVVELGRDSFLNPFTTPPKIAAPAPVVPAATAAPTPAATEAPPAR